MPKTRLRKSEIIKVTPALNKLNLQKNHDLMMDQLLNSRKISKWQKHNRKRWRQENVIFYPDQRIRCLRAQMKIKEGPTTDDERMRSIGKVISE